MKNDEITLKFTLYSLIGLTAFDAYLSIIFAQQSGNKQYLYGFIAVPFLIVAALYVNKKRKMVKTINYIKREWSNPVERKRNFKGIKSTFKKISEDDKNRFYIDDQTWNDLNMDDVYKIIDRTLSNEGEQLLYNILRTPEFDKKILKSREKLIDLFQKDKGLREKIQYYIYNTGRVKKNTAASLLWGKVPEQSRFKILYYVMCMLAVLSIVSIIFVGVKLGVLLIFVIFTANGIIHSKVKSNIYGSALSIGNIGKLVKAAQDIGNINEPMISEYTSELKRSAKICKKISDKTGVIGRIEGIDIIGDYINILFLVQEISFFSVIDDIKKYKDDLKDIYLILGKLDAIISIASYRDGLKDFTEPELVKEDIGISIKNMKHPLIENAVPNSIEISEGGIIITGSNMAGKSTFLRTFGINVLFAQTICTCLAENYRGEFLKIITSISPDDNILGGKSYYYAEAEALLRIIKSCEKQVRSLCIIDEIFRGTNPVERISSAAEILDYLPDHNALVVVATHDIELTDLVKNHYECYYFTEDVGKEGFIFDYKIRKGISKVKSAVKLLEFLGYPDEIVKRSNERVQRINLKS